jgi:hypothetical protein
MKSRLIIALSVALAVVACNKENATVQPISKTSTSSHAAFRLPADFADTTTSKFIPLDSANKMIGSYLNSINASTNDSDVRSFTVNADSLRAYLSDNSVKNIKIVFAHTLKYINSGYGNQNAGYQSGAMTMIIAAYDGSGNYVYHGGQVLDHIAPCPYTCPSGTAGGNYFE